MPAITKLRSRDLLDGLKPEDEIIPEDKRIEAKDNILEALIKGCERFEEETTSVATYPLYRLGGDEEAWLIKSILSRLPPFHAKDITQFSQVFPKVHDKTSKTRVSGFDEELVGSYLNACIQRCPENEVLIYSDKCGWRNIGNSNVSKSILVRGNLTNAAENMQGGYLHVEGNINGWAAIDMSDGMVYVKGDIYGETGRRMCGGVIIADGNASMKVIGHEMTGGVIRINGNRKIRVSQKIRGGVVYHRDQKVYDGRRVEQ